MESPTSTVLTWTNALLGGTALASITALIGYLIGWKKVPSEIHKTNAEAELADEQAEDLRFKRKLTAMEMFSEMAADVGEAQYEKLKLRKELEKANDRIKVLEIEQQQYKAERMLIKTAVVTPPASSTAPEITLPTDVEDC